MLDVLMYLYEHHMSNNCELNRDQVELIAELENVGFTLSEIHKAFRWLEGLTELQNGSKEWSHLSSPALRIFDPEESSKLGVEGMGFIHRLEQLRVLNPVTRELVIDRAMFLTEEELDIARIKWVVLMILFNSPNQEAQLAWMEDFILNGKERDGLH